MKSFIELSPTEKAAQTRARKKGRGYIGPTQLQVFYTKKVRTAACFKRRRVLTPGNPEHDKLMRAHLERVEWHGALEPFEARVLAHLRGQPIPLPPRVGGQPTRAGFSGSVVKGIQQRAA